MDTSEDALPPPSSSERDADVMTDAPRAEPGGGDAGLADGRTAPEETTTGHQLSPADAAPAATKGGGPSSGQANEWEPPAACVNRIVKAALPEQVQVTREAKQAFSKSAGIFILYLTTCANDFCRDKKRQTVSAADVMQAVSELDLDDFKAQLQAFLASFRANENGKRAPKPAASSRPSKAAKNAAHASTSSDAAAAASAVSQPPKDVDDDDDDAGVPPPAEAVSDVVPVAADAALLGDTTDLPDAEDDEI